jgi:HEAT repeat protein
LYENVSKIEDKTVLVPMVKPLTAAALEVGDTVDGVLRSPDLAYMALKQLLDKVDDQSALKSIVVPMAEALKAKEVKRRRYAAHAVMLFAHKVKDKAALWPLVQPLVAAHFHDPDETARRSAGLALERTFGRMPEPN